MGEWGGKWPHWAALGTGRCRGTGRQCARQWMGSNHLDKVVLCADGTTQTGMWLIMSVQSLWSVNEILWLRLWWTGPVIHRQVDQLVAFPSRVTVFSPVTVSSQGLIRLQCHLLCNKTWSQNLNWLNQGLVFNVRIMQLLTYVHFKCLLKMSVLHKCLKNMYKYWE